MTDMTEGKLFFKYLKIDEYTLCNLSKNQLYFNNPACFNDPFDSFCCLYIKGTKKQLIEWYRCAKPCDSKKAKTIIEEFVEKGVLVQHGFVYILNSDNKKSALLQKELHGDLKKKDLPRVCCLNTDDINILMWSHYAENHKGICLRFKFGEKTREKISDNIDEVKYVEHLSCLNILEEDIVSKVNEMIYQKFSVWTYEGEYRIVFPVNELNNNVMEYEKSDLEGVVFGLRVSREKAEQIHKTINDNYPRNKINFYRTESVRGIYKLRNAEIKNFSEYLETLEPESKEPPFEC